MFFHALIMFRFPTALNLGGLEAALADCVLRPVGPLEWATSGFIPPYGAHAAALAHMHEGMFLLAIGTEERLLPPAVIDKALQERLDAIFEQQGRRPGGRARIRMRDEVIFELLPKSHVRQTRLDVVVDTRNGTIGVNTSSRRAAEAAVSEIRMALGSFPALPLTAKVVPRGILTDWIAGHSLPSGLAIGNECELRDPADSGAVVKISNMELQGEEITQHLEAGKQCTRLALNLDDHASFVIGEDLAVRKFKLLDGAMAQLDNQDHDDFMSELTASFALMAGEFRRLFLALEQAFKINTAEV
jgi:recombination associated protein RdgC